MPLTDTLAAVERDIENGDLGKARDRLHSLVSSYPGDLSLRRRLAEVYSDLRFPAMAGRYWYLEEAKTPAMAAACAAFERSCGGDPLKILLAIKYRGDLDAIQDTYAGRTLLELRARSKARHPWFPIPVRNAQANRVQPDRKSSAGNAALLAGCLIVGLLALSLMVVGAITVIQRIFP